MAKGSYPGGGKRARSPGSKAAPTGRPAARTPSKPSQITRDELKHFSFRGRSKEAFLDELDPWLRACFKNGFTRPNEIAGLLNKLRKTTACGQPWTPHLVWGLQRFLFERREKRRAAQSGEAAPAAPVLKPASSGQGSKDLNADDMARLLGAIGRTSPSR
ncbi:hypothetical protein GCM10017620_00950 [Brevundimonas intermedia]|uniref:Uncharacterized protein n=1 Tax=Brevundimonas intermedia TaxID=74315 RepID=A0ABQ5T2Z6_9CAUL|nr:hypothetical protein [Brevundimonas intermedia]GLK47122.1 hypothetical protein GCM10017620_00950 [Brevundimonas intermedia]